jgi:acetolactate synthase regulatory subunit
MTQSQIERSVSRAISETVREIRHRGFGLVAPLEVQADRDCEDRLPLIVDWDRAPDVSGSTH